MNIIQEIEEGVVLLTAIAAMKAAIDAGESTSAPPITTFIDGKKGTITISWTPAT